LQQIIVEDEDGEVVKTYELPASQKQQNESTEAGPVRQSVTRVGAWAGLGPKKQDSRGLNAAGSPENAESSAARQGISRMATWGFGGKTTEGAGKRPGDGDDEEEDDLRIRFTIAGAGRRLTKDDFLKEIQSLDPKLRAEIVEQSDAPAAMKDMAKKDASTESPGTSRLFGAKVPRVASGKGIAKTVGAEMATRKDAKIEEGGTDDEGSENSEEREERIRRMRQDGILYLAEGKKDTPKQHTTQDLYKVNSPSNEVPESQAERRRREDALKGVDDVTPAQRGRPRTRGDIEGERVEGSRRGDVDNEESAAERRRREAALGVGGMGAQEDSDDDDTPRVPPPVAKSRGIRFAQSPVRGKR
jgi:hypothetical protein